MFREEHMNPYSIFKGAQLLEGFGALAWRLFQTHKLQERSTAKTVNALMAQDLQGAAASPPPFTLVGALESAAP